MYTAAVCAHRCARCRGLASHWFYFRASGVAGRRVCFRVLNAGGAGGECWSTTGYRVRASYDRARWFAVAEHAYDAATGELKVEPNGSPRS